MDLLNNPRVDIEKRIKQLEKRLIFLINYTRPGIIDFEDGVAVRFYPMLMPGKKREKAQRLLKLVQKEFALKTKQLKSF